MRAIKWVMLGLLGMIVAGIVVVEWKSSQVVGHSQYRFNMAVIERDGGVTFVSVDPTERAIMALPFPLDLAIRSRSIGEYSIASLYKLGSYKGEGGKFVRQKIQGFMRVPVPGYLVVTGNLKWGLLQVIVGKGETSLSRLDALLLLYRVNRYRWREIGEDELTRAGVIEDKTYHPERLQEYVGSRLFDWGIGASGVTIAIVNASGENGLGSDMADFLTNLGLDVVMVRSVDEQQETTQWQVGSEQDAKKLGYIFQSLFGFEKVEVATVGDEYRATVLIRVGKDAKELF